VLGIELAARAGRHRVSLSLTARSDEPAAAEEAKPVERVHAGEAATELAVPRPVGFGVPWDEPAT